MPSDEQHRCQWLDCTTSFTDAEALYDHITSTHIGRKSAGTLSLECHWAGCSSKATKRDHLTSHARVHINLKPHSCGICQKSFKRPQDLKKHEKIHTEEHHAHHKHSKAVTAAQNAGNGSPTHPGDPKAMAAAAAAGMQPNMFASPFPYGYPPFGFQQLQAAMFANFPGMNGGDINAFLEQQRQMNAQAVANPNFAAAMAVNPYGVQYGSYGMGMPGMPPGMQGMPGMPPGMQGMPGMPPGMQGMPMFNPAAMQAGFPYGFYSHPGQAHSIAAASHPQQQPGATIALTPHAYPLNGHPSLPTPPTPTNPHQSPASPGSASLYPTLPTLNSLYPSVVKAEDAASPAHSNHSHQSSRQSQSSASGLSPKVPSLSPASNNHSPSPEHESDVQLRRMFSGNQVAGHKRGFEDAADGFLQNLKNKRFQEEDLTQQVDGLDALALLLGPNDFTQALTPPRSLDGSSGSSVISEYHPADVENINDLLANLAQSIEEVDQSKVEQYRPTHPGQMLNNHYPHYPQPPPQQAATYGSVYPSLHPYEQQQQRPMAPMPRTTHGSQLPTSWGGHDLSGGMLQQQQQQQQQHPSIRMNKTPAPPSLSADQSRLPTFRHMEHLTRAEPTFRGAFRSEPMEVDDNDDEALNSRKGYSSSIRSTSLDAVTSSTEKLAPATPSSAPTVEPIRLSPISVLSGPRLPPMVATPASTSTTTLPPLRDVLEMNRYASSSSSSFSDADSNASSSSRPLYPSLAPVAGARPQSSGGLERLVPHFTLLGVRSESEPFEERPKVEEVDETSDGSDDDDNSDDEADHPSKKSRVDSPEPIDDASRELALAKAKRLDVIRALMLYINTQYRNSLARAAKPAADTAVVVAAPGPAPVAA